MRYEKGNLLFYRHGYIIEERTEKSWAVYEIIDMEDTDSGILYTLELKLSNDQFQKKESKFQKELDAINDNEKEELVLLEDDCDIMGQIAAYII